MRQTTQDIVQLIRTVLSEHNTFWDNQRAELKKYRNAYENKFWNNQKINDSMIRVETADCFSYVEGFIASLFSRNPAVVVAKDASMLDGDPMVAQEAVNRFLFDKREQIENASRLALIYPNSFLKLVPCSSTDMLEKTSIRAVPAWEVITDLDSTSWDNQRFCGHVYFLSIPEAKEKFGAKKFSPIPKEDYFEASKTKYDGKLTDLPNDYLYIQVIEFTIWPTICCTSGVLTTRMDRSF